ncbi:hypothetical protein D3C84_992950 [compost metagenome]
MLRTMSMASPMLTMGTPWIIAELSCWNWFNWRGRARSLTVISVDRGNIWPWLLRT